MSAATFLHLGNRDLVAFPWLKVEIAPSSQQEEQDYIRNGSTEEESWLNRCCYQCKHPLAVPHQCRRADIRDYHLSRRYNEIKPSKSKSFSEFEPRIVKFNSFPEGEEPLIMLRHYLALGSPV
jgi:hypothetical protein